MYNKIKNTARFIQAVFLCIYITKSNHKKLYSSIIYLIDYVGLDFNKLLTLVLYSIIFILLPIA